MPLIAYFLLVLLIGIDVVATTVSLVGDIKQKHKHAKKGSDKK